MRFLKLKTNTMQLKFYNFNKALNLQALTLVFFLSLFTSCHKETSTEKTSVTISSLEQNHKAKIETWFKLIPLNGKFTSIDLSKIKTISQNGQITTRIQIGGSGNSFYFVSTTDEFHVYGINALKLKSDNGYTGMLDIYDFQTLSKKTIQYEKGKIAGIVKYANSTPVINAYKNIYPIAAYRGGIVNARTASETSDVINRVRKFFCELFGGNWTYDWVVGTGGSCSTGGSGDSGEEETIDYIMPDFSGNPDLGLIWSNLNNPGYFDPYNNIWNTINAGLSGGGANVSWAITNSNYIDPAFSNPDEIRSLYFILNTQYNQQPPTYIDGSLEEILAQFSSYSNSEQVFIPIIPMLLKAGANGAADALTQALFIYLTEDDCPSFGAAFGHSKFNGWQTTRSFFEGLIPWRTPGGKIGRAAATAVGDILVNIVSGKYGSSNYQLMGSDFMLGFFSDLAGGEIGELASKYAIPKIGKGLLNKFGISYKTATGWLGGGLENVAETLSTSNGAISSIKKMVGWGTGKTCIVGRNMSGRVIPYAQAAGAIFFDKSNPLAAPYITAAVEAEWSNLINQYGTNIPYTIVKGSLWFKANKQFIEDLKIQGYTFIDLGHAGFPPSNSAFYDMELNEIFD